MPLREINQALVQVEVAILHEEGKLEMVCFLFPEYKPALFELSEQRDAVECKIFTECCGAIQLYLWS